MKDKNEVLNLLFRGYLSVSEKTFTERLKKHDFPKDAIPRMIKAELIKKLEYGDFIYYERQVFRKQTIKQFLTNLESVTNE